MEMLNLKCHNLDYTLLLLLMMMNSVFFAVSSPSSLSFNHSPPSHASSCEGGDWGGFLERSCCGAAFNDYLHALGQRANRTGKLFLDPTEQRGCLPWLARLHGNTSSGCGIEKLASGTGGCSEFSVTDVADRLGAELKSFDENCGLLRSEGSSERACDQCVKSWEGIEVIEGFKSGEAVDSAKVETDICRFSVLVSYFSTRIDDTIFFSSVSHCLGVQVHNSESQEQNQKSRANRSKGVYIIIGSLVGVLVMVLIAIFFLCKRYRKSTSTIKNHVFKNVLKKEPCCPRFSIKEVYSATNDLCESNLIGEGTSGKVYKGTLSNKQDVAIKHIVDDEDVKTFVREVTSLSHIRHPNLVALLGYCARKEDCFLIYELCPNGNLSEWLFGKDKFLSWNQRLEIAIDSARALWFLHTYPQGSIVHRDIKPTNILLGEHLRAKVSDFGLSKVISLGETYASSEVRGTFGYVDPDYQSNHRVESSGDVYSFGVVLLQIISGQKVINMNMQKPMPINKMAKALTRFGNIADFADPKLGGEYSTKAFDLVLQLALSCTVLKQQRPSMEQIVAKLEEALEISSMARVSSEAAPERNA